MKAAIYRQLGDLTEFQRSITYGVVKPGPEDPNGIRFIRGGDVVAGRIEVDALRTITPHISNNYKRTLLRGGELLVSLVGNPGEVAVAPESLAGANIARQVGLIALREEFNKRFVMYFLMSPLGRAALFTQTGGAVQQVINLADLRRVEVPLPHRRTQDCIVETLCAYDDLIANNTRRIKLLEDAARLLYEEWFVRLRFPGHEHTTIRDGIPGGWTKTTVAKVVEICGGGTPRTTMPEFWNGGIPFYTPKDSTPHFYVLGTEKTLSELGLNSCSSRLYPKDTLFITARGTVGNLNLAQCPMAMNQSCYALIAREPLTQRVLYLAMNAAVDHFRSHAVGAVFNTIIRDTFKRISFLFPEPRLVRAFDDIIRPIFNQAENLLIQNGRLRQARDLLLPRLMSGEVAV